MSQPLSLYLSQLVVNLGDRSDRVRPGYNWIRQQYRVHQRLCMAFPSAERQQRDPDFLDPFFPEEFPLAPQGERHVHAARDGQRGFLFRIEHDHPKGTVILVQSATRPNWDYAFHNAEFLLATAPESPGWQVRLWQPDIENESRWRFRLVANPSVKRWTGALKPDGTKKTVRHGLMDESAQRQWLLDRSEGRDKSEDCSSVPGHGFAIDKDTLAVEQLGTLKTYRSRSADTALAHHAVKFDGILRVTHEETFAKTVASGIGSAKGFGFGLLSVARAT